MVTPRKADFASVPLNQEGQKVGNSWDPATDGSCLAYGAAGLMRNPTRLAHHVGRTSGAEDRDRMPGNRPGASSLAPASRMRNGRCRGTRPPSGRSPARRAAVRLRAPGAAT